MINFAKRICNAATDKQALSVYARYISACDATYVRAMQSSDLNPSRLKRNTEAYKGLMLQTRFIVDALAKRGILRKALDKHPMKY